MEHPQKNELFLLKKSIDSIPYTYSEKDKKAFENKYLKLEANPKATREEISALIVEVGKATWVHRKAYEEFIDTYFKDKLEDYFRIHLDPVVAGKYKEFVKSGRNINDVRRTKEFEEYFTSEENLLIEKALFTARDEIRVSVKGTINDRTDEYNEHVKVFEQKKKDYVNMIKSLKEMADKSEKWAPEILDKIAMFEEGWSVIERDFDEDKLRHEIEYWQGVTGLE